MNNIAVLFRDYRDGSADVEIPAIRKHFPVYELVNDPNLLNKTVIGRFSVLPFYREVQEELKLCGSKLINSYSEHRFVADISNWCEILKDLTPRTWFDLSTLPDDISFVVKGETNSKKFLWDTHMFAKDKKEAVEVYLRLMEDSMISQQRIVFREYVPLRKLDDGLRGLPISEEYRFFVLNGKVVSGAFYWSSYSELLEQYSDLGPEQVPQSFIDKILYLVSPHIPFFVMDIGRTASGNWIVIELNDAQMSGLSENNPDVLWKNIKRVMATS